MAYQTLYLKYRSQRFGDLVGQDAIAQTLRNAVEQGRVAHAYLFCGVRGTGKTSTARILAKAINCLDRRGAEPCGVCANCVEIGSGAAVDLIEIDAASNRGIDEIRDLRERVKYLPATLKVKVYIIDEAHMLTTEAFNALLKTLEEPPAHVVFVLATTEPHKIPLTVASRCQRFDFRRIDPDTLVRLLAVVTEGDGAKTLGELQRFYDAGGDVRQLVRGLLGAIREAALLSVGYQDAESLGGAASAGLERIGRAAGRNALLSLWKGLMEMEPEVRKGADASRVSVAGPGGAEAEGLQPRNAAGRGGGDLWGGESGRAGGGRKEARHAGARAGALGGVDRRRPAGERGHEPVRRDQRAGHPARERLGGSAVQDAQAAAADAGQDGQDPGRPGPKDGDRHRRRRRGRGGGQWSPEGAIGHAQARGCRSRRRRHAPGPGAGRRERRHGPGARPGEQGDGRRDGGDGASTRLDGVADIA